MSKENYIDHLKKRGYTILSENQVSDGHHKYDIVEQTQETAAGPQRTFYLQLVGMK